MSMFVPYDEDAWKADALCAETDPEAFFPEKGDKPYAALRICQRCAVQKECLQYAVENNERYGVWGGTTEKQRQELRRHRSSRLARHAAA